MEKPQNNHYRIRAQLLLASFLLFSCASTMGSYTTNYVEGKKAADKFVEELIKKNIKHKVVLHRDNIFEIQYKEPKEN